MVLPARLSVSVKCLTPATTENGRHRLCPVQADANPQPAAAASSGTFDQVQSQVNEVKVILKDNINKVLERGDKIDDLIGKTDDLQASVSTR